jgi:hypothetical protein
MYKTLTLKEVERIVSFASALRSRVSGYVTSNFSVPSRLSKKSSASLRGSRGDSVFMLQEKIVDSH